ncbi:MAG: acyl--CoA ligase [Acidimicrobiales bacterium]|nr:acyl--CoA ligase [Acidimicrobiales bacterium]
MTPTPTPPGGPADIHDVVTLLRDAAHTDPDVDAFVDGQRHRISFGEWNRRADGVAAALADRGVGIGDVVCLLLPSSIEYMIAYQAVVRLGAVVTGVNARLGPSEIEHLLTIATPAVTVVPDGTDVALPPVAGTVVAWHELAGWYDVPAPPLPALDERQLVLICWTGGTTGRPRGALFDHANLAAVARGTGVLSAPYDRRLSPIPFAHVGTMTRSWDEISRRITTVITPVEWTAPAALALIEAERVTVAQGVPTQWELMLRDPSFPSTDVSSLRLAGIGGSPVSPDLLRRMRQQLGVPVVNRYAATEAGGLISGTRPDDPDHVITDTVGRASDGVEIRIVDDGHEPVPVGTIGLIQVRSGAVMGSYVGDPNGTAAVIDEEGWLTVGDIGRLDPAGNLTLVGRKGDMYVRGGYNVYPVEVERRLAEHPAVTQVAVVSAADDVLGEIGVAAVVVVPGGAAPTLAELRDWVRAELADYKAPDRLAVLDAFPHTALGKVDRRELSRRANEEVSP